MTDLRKKAHDLVDQYFDEFEAAHPAAPEAAPVPAADGFEPVLPVMAQVEVSEDPQVGPGLHNVAPQ